MKASKAGKNKRKTIKNDTVDRCLKRERRRRRERDKMPKNFEKLQIPADDIGPV